MSAKRSHGPTVSVQFQHLIHQPTWNKSSHGKFANIRALPSPPSRLHTGQGGKVAANGAWGRFTLQFFTRDALGRTSRAEQASQAFTFLGSPKLVRHVRSTRESRHSLRRSARPLCASGSCLSHSITSAARSGEPSLNYRQGGVRPFWDRT
jgi:hypothetical protein